MARTSPGGTVGRAGAARKCRDGTLLALLLAAGIGAGTGNAATILVPEEMTLADAIAESSPGDTLNLSGTFERIPEPFVKRLTLIGRNPANPPTLRGLTAGGCRLIDLSFAPASLTGDPNDLVVATDSLELVRCRFTGITRVGLSADDEGGTPRVVRLVDCTFEALVRAVDLDFTHPSSRMDIRGGHFRDLMDGIRLVTPVRDCPPGMPGDAPPIPAGTAVLDIEDALFEDVDGAVLRIENATSGLDLRRTRLVGYGRGIELLRAGARIDDSELDGMTEGAVGVDGLSCRIEITRSWVRFNESGIRLGVDGGCERNSGFVGGTRETSCGLSGNLVGIDSVDPIACEANWWGALSCPTALESAPGQVIHLITDETRELLLDCQTPVRPTTWSRIKAGRPG